MFWPILCLPHFYFIYNSLFLLQLLFNLTINKLELLYNNYRAQDCSNKMVNVKTSLECIIEKIQQHFTYFCQLQSKWNKAQQKMLTLI